MQAMPGLAPGFSSYVEFEVKKGKWNKRWLELRDNNLWVAKRDNVSILSIVSLVKFLTASLSSIGQGLCLSMFLKQLRRVHSSAASA
jgi:hypothetical protein